jgi:hypothetical protein
VNHTHFRRPLLALVALTCAGLLPAAEPAKPAEPAKAPAPAKKPAQAESSLPDTEVVVLPKIQVTSTRIHELDVTIAKLDKLIVREKKKIKPTNLDKTLNNQKVSTVAAIFGGNSSEHLSAVAASRVSLMETERALLEDMKRPASVTDLAQMETELDQLRLTRRNLDSAQAQR